jgi:hypothetical protein
MAGFASHPLSVNLQCGVIAFKPAEMQMTTNARRFIGRVVFGWIMALAGLWSFVWEIRRSLFGLD